MYKLYRLMAGISLLVRQFLLPNPFDMLPHPYTIELSEISIAIPPLVLNIIVEPMLHAVTFAVVGIYYITGESPVCGSFLYLVFYAVHVGLLMIMAKIQFATWAVIIIIVLYFTFHFGLLLLLNHSSAA